MRDALRTKCGVLICLTADDIVMIKNCMSVDKELDIIDKLFYACLASVPESILLTGALLFLISHHTD